MPNFRITQQHTAAPAQDNSELYDSVWGIVDPANVSHDGHGVYSYSGEGESNEKDIASIRTRLPLDPMKRDGMSSFEVTLLDTGELNYIAIGMCNSAYPTHLLPGWEEVSVAFHTDEGSIFNSSDDAIPLNKACKNGDTVKVSITNCLQDPSKVNVEFSCNSVKVYNVQTTLPEGGFYGVVGLMSRGEKIKISPPVLTRLVDFDELWEVSTPHSITHEGGGVCAYSGVGDFKESSIGTVRHKSPVEPLGDLSKRSLEVQILNPGEARYIAIGVVSQSYPTNLFPGWKKPSIGYHADNGNLFSGMEQTTNRPCKAGDVMKCTLEAVDGSPKRVQISFHRNKVEVGQLMTWTPPGGFYLCVGMMSRSEKVNIVLPEVVTPYKLPTHSVRYEEFWEELSPNLVHNGRGHYEYVGQGGQEHVGSLRSKHPLNPFDKNNWFEVKIVNGGANCYIALGVCSSHYSSTMLLGWDDLSVGFHADNGYILQSNLEEKATSHPCRDGDVIRCTIEPIDRSDKQVKVSFHKNSNLVGKTTFWKPGSGFFAQVGCMSVGESIRVLSPSMGLPPLRPGLDTPPTGPTASRPIITPKGTSQAASNPPSESGFPTAAAYPHFGMRAMYDPHTFYHMHHGHLPPPHPGGVRPHHMYMSHPFYRPPHPYLGQPVPPRHPFSLPPYADPSSSYPPVQSPSQPRRQLSEQVQPLTSPEHGEPPKRLFTHPLDVHSASAPQLGTFEPQPERRVFQGEETVESRFSPVHESSAITVAPVGLPHGVVSSPSFFNPTSEDVTSSLQQQVEQDKCKQTGDFQQRHSDYSPQASAAANPPQQKGYPAKGLADKPSRPPTEQTPSTNEQPRAVGGIDHTDSSPDLTAAVQQTIEQAKLISKETVSSQPKPVSSHLENHPPKHARGGIRPPLSSQISVLSHARTITKTENRHFKVLHNVNYQDPGGPFESSLPEDERLDNAFTVSRLPLTEKNSYFEVEIQHIGSEGNVAIGMVWDNYPVFHLPGVLEGSIAFHSMTGSVQTGGAEVVTNEPAVSCKAGDVIGCRALLKYKSEVSDNKENSVQVDFYFNGCLLATANVFLPPSGFFAAIGFKGYRSKVKFSRSVRLSPETYFETHPLPKNYQNFPSPPPLPTGWTCLRNSEVKADGMLCVAQYKAGSPAVILNAAPLSKTTPYFEIELQHTLNNYSVLAIGAMPKSVIDTKKVIPGEATDSIGYLPLLGFVMRNGSISSTIPDTITSSLHSEKVKIGVGIDFNSKPTNLDLSLSLKGEATAEATPPLRVKVFFTINSQQVSCIFTSLPKEGLYPSLAIDSDSIKTTDFMATVLFPAQWPPFNQLPVWFVRCPHMTERVIYSSLSFVDTRSAVVDVNAVPVRALQAAVPLSQSKSYYEVNILNGGESFRVSCGLAAYNYPLNAHPGWQKDSIALHADDGNLFHNGKHLTVSPPCRYKGAVLGCGLRFPKDGKPPYAEAFFTLNKKLVAKQLVRVPQLGFFPTVGMRTIHGIITINLDAPDPLPDMKFGSAWGDTSNMKVEGNTVQLVSLAEPGAIIQALPRNTGDLAYFSITPLSVREGRIVIGFSTSPLCPLTLLQSNVEDLKAFAVDITMGVVMVYDHYFQTKETLGLLSGIEFGCGLLPKSPLNKAQLFFTVDGQAISYTPIDEVGEEVYPFIMMMESSLNVQVNMCTLWLPSGPLGRGWGRHTNVKLEESKLTHSVLPGTKRKFPVGFLQTCEPLTPFSPYFEIEVCSRANDKAIAIGLASRRYPLNAWVGWGRESIAYHLDDGKVFKVSNYGHSFGPKAYAGDTVGCGVRFGPCSSEDGKTEVFFTFNGWLVGTQKVSIPADGMFPTVCLESPTEAIIFNRHDQFPPVSSLVCEREWARAYSVMQSGLLIQNSQTKLIPGASKAFCQAKDPFTPCKNFFEILITGANFGSQLQMGLTAQIPKDCTTPNTYGVMYSIQGQIISRRVSHRSGTQKYTTNAQKAGIGDRLGCLVVFTNNISTAVDFYLNRMKVTTLNIVNFWHPQNVYPTIVLTNPEDSVVPFLNIPKPEWDPNSLAGWLRSERVQTRNRVVEYCGGPGKGMADIGVAQLGQALQLSKQSYFELEVLDPGEKCTIVIGLAPADYPLNRQPGWERDSIAYHGDDGRLFQVSTTGGPFGPRWKRNDVIGLGIRSHSVDSSLVSEVQVYFTRNGTELGHTTHRVPPSGLFPTIGMHSPGEKIKIKIIGSAKVPCNIDPKRASWRTLSGINLSSREHDSQVLTFAENGRQQSKMHVLTSLAVSSQPFSSSMQYFEVELLGVGPLGIAVGVAPSSYPIDQATGWGEGSVAYHTDDGCLYNSTIKGTVFGPVPHKGDVIGCGVTFSSSSNPKHSSVLFTYNGCEIGRVRTNYMEGGLFPSVTLTTTMDKVVVRQQETFKPRHPQAMDLFVGLMRIQNCSYSDHLVRFSGAGASGYTNTPAMAQFAVPLHHNRNYFAANIVKRSDNILVGLAVKDYPMRFAPGASSVSIAYDIMHGKVKAVYGSDSHYSLDAPVCHRGDTVGCGIDHTGTKEEGECVFFTRNSVLVCRVKLAELMDDLFPVVGFNPQNKNSVVFMDWSTPLYQPRNVLTM